MEDGSEKALRLKAQRSELQKKLEDWENTWQIIHGFPATDHDRLKSHEHRELSRLLVDVDEYVSALERGTANTVAPSVASKDAERRAERGRIKARMRRWEKDFERRMGRKPTEADIEASGEMESYRQQLKSINAGGASSTSDGGKASPEAAAAAAASGGAAAFVGGGKPLAPSAASAFDAPTEWAKGSDYHELLRARVSSHSSVNGFEGVSLTELHGAASSFAAWDLDHDGVLSKEEALTVLASLAEEADGGGGGAPDAQTLERLFALMDADGNGVIDFNEWLAVRKQI